MKHGWISSLIHMWTKMWQAVNEKSAKTCFTPGLLGFGHIARAEKGKFLNTRSAVPSLVWNLLPLIPWGLLLGFIACLSPGGSISVRVGCGRVSTKVIRVVLIKDVIDRLIHRQGLSQARTQQRVSFERICFFCNVIRIHFSFHPINKEVWITRPLNQIACSSSVIHVPPGF